MARNPFFKFQQFTVYHDKCAMKVGTDGTLLGAWADVSKASTALDIGIGSGLISLMIAQKNPNLQVTGIDIESSAITQAKENVNNSPFSARISIIEQAVQHFFPSNKFDIIISNPPFFTETLKSPCKQRATARHADNLSAEELIRFASDHLNSDGRLSVIYPFHYKEELLNLGEIYHLYPTRITNVYPTPQSAPKRILVELSKLKNEIVENDLTVEIDRHIYSDEFKNLMRNFYLQEIPKNI